MSAASYALEHPGDVLAVLDRLQRERTLATVSFDDGFAIVSSVLEVQRDPKRLIFDIAHDGELNDRLFGSSIVHFVSELDHIWISFEAGMPERTMRRDGPAAAVDIPRAVTRLQRRESFRAALPVNPPMTCTVVDAEGRSGQAHAIDLSCGGAAVVMDEPASDRRAGTGHELILSLPDTGAIGIEANLRTILPLGGERSTRVRLGFRFDRLPATTAARIQRYVQQVEVRQLRLLRRRE